MKVPPLYPKPLKTAVVLHSEVGMLQNNLSGVKERLMFREVGISLVGALDP